MSKKYTYRQKRKYVDKEKQLDNLHYKLFIGFAIIKITHYLFIAKHTIGGNIFYSLLTFWLPVLIGILSFAIYRREFIITIISATKGFIWKILRFLFIIAQGILASYVSFTTVSDIIWEQLNNIKIKNSSIELVECEVTRFWSGKGSRGRDQIEFEFMGDFEKIRVDYKYIKKYLDENPSDYSLQLKIKEGLNETFVIDSWELNKIR